MKNYKSFFNLNKQLMILEGYIEYSDDFYSKLNKIKSKSRIARLLLTMYELEVDDDELKNNYIDISDKDDKVSFISQVKYHQIISKLSKSTQINNPNPYKISSRNEISVGRLVKSFMEIGGYIFTGKELEEFVNLYKSSSSSNDELFSIVSGDTIKYWYSADNYFDDYGNSTLKNSCMKDSDSSFFEIYSENECCRLLILTKKDNDENKLIGRALVWKLSESIDGAEYFLDRIYCMRDSDEYKFREYAEKEGWLIKFKNNSDLSTNIYIMNKGNKIKSRMECNIYNISLNGNDFPYMDTFKFMNKDSSKISNIGFHNGVMLDDTEGSFNVCDFCGGTGYSDNSMVDCVDCKSTGFVPCEKCESEGFLDENCKKCNGEGVVPNDRSDNLCMNCVGLI